MALIIVISTGDFQIRWNVLSLSFSEKERGKWPLGLSDFYHNYAGINFIQNHPPPGTNPRDTTRREQKPSPRDNNCVQKPFPRDKIGSQKPHPRDIKLENSDTISNEKLCRLNK